MDHFQSLMQGIKWLEAQVASSSLHVSVQDNVTASSKEKPSEQNCETPVLNIVYAQRLEKKTTQTPNTATSIGRKENLR